MDCETCTIVDVCKIADSVRVASIHAALTVTNCKIKQRLQGAIATGPAILQPAATQFPAQPQTFVPGIRQYRDFNAESKAADELAKGLEENVKKVVVVSDDQTAPAPDVKVACPSCQAMTTEDDIGLCEKCGNTMVCSNCATESGNKRICDPCWNE